MTGLNGNDPSKVASLDEARKRAVQKAKSQPASDASDRGPRAMRDWVIGGIVIALALGFIASLVMPALQSIGGGAQ